MRDKKRRCRGLFAALGLCAPAVAQSPAPSVHDFSNLGLEELLQVEVVSVSRKVERLVDAPAAITVVTRHDIERSGARTIPEALRMVPGLHVAQVDGSRWAISARGFTSEFANKLLVLIDGRTVYTSIFSGVFWDAQDLLLEDIERIDVIRGPGGASWGVNAMNGVINIITRHAKDTTGALVTTRVGTEMRALAGGRFGGSIGDHTWYRLYAQGFTNDDAKRTDDSSAHDAWSQGIVGFRVDSEPNARDAWTATGQLQGNASDHEWVQFLRTAPYTQVNQGTAEHVSGHGLVRWQRTHGDESVTSAQASLQAMRRVSESDVGARESIAEVDLRHVLVPTGAHRLAGALGWRFIHDELVDGANISWRDHVSDVDVGSASLQDEITLVDDTLDLILGVKLEHNDYTGFETQPDARLRLHLTERDVLWASASRAVRMPSRAQDTVDGLFGSQAGQGGVAVNTNLLGNTELRSENLWGYEIGWRHQRQRLLFDASAFFHDYSDLMVLQQGTPQVDPGPPPRVVVPLTYENGGDAHAYGFETSATYSVSDTVQVQGAWSFLRVDVQPRLANLPTFKGEERLTPEHQVHLRGTWRFRPDFQLDTLVSYIDNVPTRGADSFVRLDLRLGFEPSPRTRVALVLQKRLRVLVAEDTVVNQRLISSVLTKLGCDVTLACDGNECVEQYGRARFDVILMDVQMPELDGLGATGAIRALEATSGRHTPIIALTANAMASDRAMCLAAGMDDYLAKPLRISMLRAKLEALTSSGVRL